MASEIDELKSKLELSFRLVDTAYLFRNEQVNDSAKRTVMRVQLIQVDNLLVMVPRLKNLIFGSRQSSDRTALEEAIDELKKSYVNSYDLIRDKVAAHGQQLDAMSCFYAWGDLDYSTTEVLYGDIKHLQSLVEAALDHRFPTIPDYAPLDIAGNAYLSVPTGAEIRLDRFAATRPNTGYMLPLCSSQDKAQIVLSILDFLNVDFAITAIVDDPKTLYRRFLFEIGWLMAVIDLCSLIDNLFVDDTYGKSLLSEWKDAGVVGHSDLLRLEGARDVALENALRLSRNKLGAHIDRTEDIQVLLDRYFSLDLGKIDRYFGMLIDGFYAACRKDFRTRMFLIHTSPITRMVNISGEGRPFDDR
ncbi:hypothetical protein RM530_14645 [Algiphilus sp. W345]|uniref:Uncharacterized protein n=1 Tax=Banduia mediterranea TaxID=3075609 RepID=A0ABU2WL46_9GAMM|nr:hypothetical protein [Algiphilus sp. W345]MDT0498587.1 hypothetical protein [Algiphilus sp. W345]